MEEAPVFMFLKGFVKCPGGYGHDNGRNYG